MYKDYSDQELIYLIKEGNETASNILYDKYKDIVNIKAKKYISYGKKLGLEYNDLFQEGMVGLSNAINSYTDEKNTIFSTFANMCIDRKMITSLVINNRKKYNALNESCSLDSVIDNDTSTTLLDLLFSNELDPSLKIESDEKFNEIVDLLYKDLSRVERQVFDLKMSGFEYKEIGILLDKSYKSIDCTMQRIRVKLRNILTKIDNYDNI